MPPPKGIHILTDTQLKPKTNIFFSKIDIINQILFSPNTLKAHRHAIQKLHCINSAYIYKTMEHADNINYKPNCLAEIVRLCWLCYDDKCFLAYTFFSCKKKCLTLTRFLDNRIKVEIKICETGTKTSTSFAGTPVS